MKLLVISMLYEPDCVGIAAIATDLCRGLVQQGHDVTVYTTYPYYPEWKRKSDAGPWRIQRETIAGVKVVRHGLFIPRRPSQFLPRLVHELSFPVSLMRSLFARERYDAVMVFCPLLGSVAFAAVRKMVHREPLWINVQDLPVEAGINTGISRSVMLGRLASFAQRALFRSGEVCSSISTEMVDQLATIRGEGTQNLLCPNWLVDPLAQLIQARPKVLKTPTDVPLKLLYCGTIGKKQDLTRFCEALHRTDLDVTFQVFGAGSEAERLQHWINEHRDRRFSFGPLNSDAGFIEAIDRADWFVITEMHGAGSSFLPSKLIPCIALGTPVLAVCDATGPLGREVARYDLGMMLSWADADQLESRMRQIQNDSAQYELYQRNCLARSRDLRRETMIQRVEEHLAQLVQGSTVARKNRSSIPHAHVRSNKRSAGTARPR